MDISRERLELVVDAVAEALNVDTGICPEGTFEKAVEAARAALTPKHTAYISVVDGAIQIHLFRVCEETKEASKDSVRSMDELKDWCRKWHADNFMCSSSIDFPEDSTDDPAIIAICEELRS